MKALLPGQEIHAQIVAISGDTVFLDLNSKSEGVLDSAELKDADGNLTVKEGDTIKAFFLSDVHGEIRFTTKIAGDKADKSILENAWKNHIPVEGHVEKEIKGGYEVKIGSNRAFCPYSQMGFRQKEVPDTFVGKQLTFHIQEYKEDGRNILVSNRSILQDAYEQHLEEIKQTLKEGMVVTGKVTSLQSFGAFVEINGFKALLPISEIAMTRVADIHDVLKEGQTITVKILKADWQNEKMSVSLKSLLADPWSTVEEKYKIEQKLTGTISRIVEFGVFVSLEAGLDGLVHISELEDAGANTNLRKLYKVGTSMAVQILGIDVEQKRISLRPASSAEQDENSRSYMNHQDDDGDTYNPFAALLKKK